MAPDLKHFCKYHTKTEENPDGTDCSAHLTEARCFECPYTLENIHYARRFGTEPELFISTTPDPFKRVCVDFVPPEGLAKVLIKRLASAAPARA